MLTLKLGPFIENLDADPSVSEMDFYFPYTSSSGTPYQQRNGQQLMF